MRLIVLVAFLVLLTPIVSSEQAKGKKAGSRKLDKNASKAAARKSKEEAARYKAELKELKAAQKAAKKLENSKKKYYEALKKFSPRPTNYYNWQHYGPYGWNSHPHVVHAPTTNLQVTQNHYTIIQNDNKVQNNVNIANTNIDKKHISVHGAGLDNSSLGHLGNISSVLTSGVEANLTSYTKEESVKQIKSENESKSLQRSSSSAESGKYIQDSDNFVSQSEKSEVNEASKKESSKDASIRINGSMNINKLSRRKRSTEPVVYHYTSQPARPRFSYVQVPQILPPEPEPVPEPKPTPTPEPVTEPQPKADSKSEKQLDSQSEKQPNDLIVERDIHEVVNSRHGEEIEEEELEEHDEHIHKQHILSPDLKNNPTKADQSLVKTRNGVFLQPKVNTVIPVLKNNINKIHQANLNQLHLKHQRLHESLNRGLNIWENSKATKIHQISPAGVSRSRSGILGLPPKTSTSVNTGLNTNTKETIQNIVLNEIEDTLYNSEITNGINSRLHIPFHKNSIISTDHGVYPHIGKKSVVNSELKTAFREIENSEENSIHENILNSVHHFGPSPLFNTKRTNKFSPRINPLLNLRTNSIINSRLNTIHNKEVNTLINSNLDTIYNTKINSTNHSVLKPVYNTGINKGTSVKYNPFYNIGLNSVLNSRLNTIYNRRLNSEINTLYNRRISATHNSLIHPSHSSSVNQVFRSRHNPFHNSGSNVLNSRLNTHSSRLNNLYNSKLNNIYNIRSNFHRNSVLNPVYGDDISQRLSTRNNPFHNSRMNSVTNSKLKTFYNTIKNSAHKLSSRNIYNTGINSVHQSRLGPKFTSGLNNGLSIRYNPFYNIRMNSRFNTIYNRDINHIFKSNLNTIRNTEINSVLNSRFNQGVVQRINNGCIKICNPFYNLAGNSINNYELSKLINRKFNSYASSNQKTIYNKKLNSFHNTAISPETVNLGSNSIYSVRGNSLLNSRVSSIDNTRINSNSEINTLHSTDLKTESSTVLNEINGTGKIAARNFGVNKLNMSGQNKHNTFVSSVTKSKQKSDSNSRSNVNINSGLKTFIKSGQSYVKNQGLVSGSKTTRASSLGYKNVLNSAFNTRMNGDWSSIFNSAVTKDTYYDELNILHSLLETSSTERIDLVDVGRNELGDVIWGLPVHDRQGNFLAVIHVGQGEGNLKLEPRTAENGHVDWIFGAYDDRGVWHEIQLKSEESHVVLVEGVTNGLPSLGVLGRDVTGDIFIPLHFEQGHFIVGKAVYPLDFVIFQNSCCNTCSS